MGFIEDTKTYTLQGLSEALGYKQARTVERLLEQINCPVVRLGAKRVVSGKQFRLAVEKQQECFNTSLHGS